MSRNPRDRTRDSENRAARLEQWVPKTRLGKLVQEGKITTIEDVFLSKYTKKESKSASQNSEYGKKARKAIRGALASKDPKQALNLLAGKSYKDLADIADRGSVSNKSQLSDATEEVAETPRQVARKDLIRKFSAGFTTHTPELEQQIKDLIVKKGANEQTKQKAFDEMFYVLPDKNGKKLIIVKDDERFDRLRNQETVMYNDQIRVKDVNFDRIDKKLFDELTKEDRAELARTAKEREYYDGFSDVRPEDLGEGTWVRFMKAKPKENEVVALAKKQDGLDFEWLEGTPEDEANGRKIAAEIKNLKFNGVQTGIRTKDKTVPPHLFFTILDKGKDCLLYTSPSPRDS